MRTYLDCIPCFMKQTLATGRVATSDELLIKEMLDVIGNKIASFSVESTPPEMGKIIYRTIREMTGNNDPYKNQKAIHIAQAIKLYGSLQEHVNTSDNKLLTAIRIAIAGNVIDLGMSKPFDMEQDLLTILGQPLAICHLDSFASTLSSAKSILYLGDNAGESVFDKILIEAMQKPVTYVVREHPVINDVTMEDALASGIQEVASIISSGSDAPGILLNDCSDEFRHAFENADMIISKGQGNYETLSETTRPVFFLLKAKCHVIAHHLGVNENDIVLKDARV